MQVGDDRRSHRANLAAGGPRRSWLRSQSWLNWPGGRLSEERLAPANGIEIAYQEIGDPGGEPLLLVMGLATQMLGWHEGFCALLAERGFRVIRFDNRDIGRSTKVKSAGVPSRADMMIGRRSTAPYLLSDMAADTTGLMDHLGSSPPTWWAPRWAG